MESGAVPGGTIPPSLVPPPARLLPLPRTRSRTASTAPLQIPLHQSTPPVGGGFTSMPWITEQGGQAAGDFEQDPVEVILAELQAASDVLRSRPSSTSNKNGKEGTPTTSHDLSPAATNGSKRRSRKLTSFIWNDAEPIYIDGFLMQGRCKYCSTVFPASKVSGTSQLSRHLKVCKVKGSVDGVIHQSTPPVGGGITSMPSTTEQGGQVAGDLEQDPVGSIYMEKQTSGVVRVELQDASDVLRLRPSSRKKGKKPQGSGEACREPQWSGDARVEQQNSKTRVEQRGGSEVPISETVGGKRSLSDANESSRARKAAKTINAKGIPTTSHDLSPAATNGSKRRPRKLNSIIWNDAKPIYIDGFLMQGRCKYCSTVFPASRVSGNSQLARHLKVCKAKGSMDVVIQQIRTPDELYPDWKFDQGAARIELVKLIVLHGLPFSFVEYAGFRKFCASLNPWFKSANSVAVQNDCMDAYYQYRNTYESFFMNCNHRVSLTGDMWTSNQKLGYLCITCHWIDSKWRIRHRIISFCLIETPHDAWNMFGVVLKRLRDWNIENRIFSFTMDNAEVNTKMISHLKKHLVDRDLIHHEGKLLHIQCADHMLNLTVQDGLKAMKSVVDNIRESVKYIRSSQSRKEQFANMVAKVGIKCKHQPTPDVSSRWDSTFLMLESTLPFREVFETLQEQEPNYTFGLSAEEWKMVEDICELLKVFCHATNVISGSNYPTSNLYFFEIWSVKLILDKQAKSDSATIRIIVKEMENKFHKYFMESYLTNCIPVILDPRFKMEHVEFRLTTYFGVDAPKHIQEVMTAINALCTEYAAELEGVVDLSTQERNEEGVVLADSALSDWDEHVKLKKANNRNELQRYLEEDFHPRTADFDILKWWDVNSARYPILASIARDVLAVPASATTSESAFSTCGRVITDHMSSLAPETVEALMCVEDWIRPDGSSSEASTPLVQ
uniref:Uncharacterized protein n=2 Tax=Avena sativa TaxID=4498 RepID=A0ACD5VDA3_AVESA